MKKNYPEITKLRGFAILMVLLYHSIIVYPIDLRAIGWCKNLAEVLWQIEMPLFFLVSGFCYSYEDKYSTYVVKKVKRILIPHVVFGIIDLMFRVLPKYIPFMGNLVNEKTTLWDGAKEFVVYASIDPFLRSLFIMFLVFPFIAKLIKRGKTAKYLLFIAALLLYIFSDRITPVTALSYTARFFIYFLIGYMVKDNGYEKVKPLILRPLMVFGSGILAVLSFVCYLLPGMKAATDIFVIEKLLLFIAAVSAAVVMYAVANMGLGVLQHLVTMAGNYSLQLYLFGGYVLVVSRLVVVTYLGIEMPALVILLNFVMDILIMCPIIHFIVRKVRLFCFLTGLTCKKKNK